MIIKRFYFRLFAFILALVLQNQSMVVYADNTTPIPLTPKDGNIGNNGEGHRAPVLSPIATIEDHTLCIYSYAEKQVRVYPVDYNDETSLLYSANISENTFSTSLPLWLNGIYAIEIEINGYVFVGEIELSFPPNVSH